MRNTSFSLAFRVIGYICIGIAVGAIINFSIWLYKVSLHNYTKMFYGFAGDGSMVVYLLLLLLSCLMIFMPLRAIKKAERPDFPQLRISSDLLRIFILQTFGLVLAVWMLLSLIQTNLYHQF